MDVTATIEAGLAALGAKDLKRAEALFASVLAVCPGEPNALHFMGAVRQLEGRGQEAEGYFRTAVEADPGDAAIHNSLGNLLNQQGLLSDALACFEAALALEPGLRAAQMNAAIMLQRLGRHEAALSRLGGIAAPDAHTWTATGLSLKELGRFAAAEAAYRQALELKPKHFSALHNLGGVLALQGRAQEAIEVFEQALSIGPKVPELRFAYATALYDAGDVDGADREFRTAVALKPHYVEAHDALNRLYWQEGKRALYGRSYEVCLKAAPASPPLWHARVRALELAGQTGEALAVTEQALAAVGATAPLLHRQARLHAGLGDTEASLAAYTAAIGVAEAADAAPIWLDRAKLLTRRARYDEALAALEQVEAAAPHDQEMWAYRGLCWRLCGDARAAWLNDYDRFIHACKIAVPDGYDSLSAFLAALEDALGRLHSSKSQPIDQTLKGGTQSNGALLTRPDPAIKALRSALAAVVQAYIAGLPDDPQHPFLARKSASFHFSGSWSVCLSPGGFHVNHVHPRGWISSSFYVSVPPSVAGGDTDHQGWIKFGESGASLGPEREVVAHRVRPEPGLVVLFPSYMWHGTEPFTENAPRLTTPFDIVPA